MNPVFEFEIAAPVPVNEQQLRATFFAAEDVLDAATPEEQVRLAALQATAADLALFGRCKETFCILFAVRLQNRLNTIANISGLALQPLYNVGAIEHEFYPTLQGLNEHRQQVVQEAKEAAWALFHARNTVEFDLDEPGARETLTADPVWLEMAWGLP